MEWYYAGEKGSVGPVPEAEFDALIGNGTIQPDNLVWHQGMTEWQPLRAVRDVPVPAPVSAPPVLEAGGPVCSECNQPYPASEMIQLSGAWVCARCKLVFLQRLREGLPAKSAVGLWRDGSALVMTRGATLPARCAKCNQPVSRPPIKRTLYWHASWIYLLILISLLIYLVVALIVRKKAVVLVPVCDAHRRQRALVIAISWLLVLGGIGTFIAAATEESGSLVVGGIVLLLAGIVLGVWKGTLVAARKIDDQVVSIRGFCAQFLEGLPEWRHLG